MDSLEQLLRKWWSRLTAWMRSPERSAQAAEAARKAKAALSEVRESEAARRAEAAVRDLRDSEATRKAQTAAKEALRDLRDSDATRKAKEALRDLRDSDATRKAKGALRDLRDDLRTGDTGRKAKAAIRDLRGNSDSERPAVLVGTTAVPARPPGVRTHSFWRSRPGPPVVPPARLRTTNRLPPLPAGRHLTCPDVSANVRPG